MESNVLIEQYGKYKKEALKESPYRCLLDTDIEINPHQINAFCAAIRALPTGGIVLADEVGLGKTIEAGLVLKYVIDTGAKKIMIALPAALRKQWEIELEEKFSLSATILDRAAVKRFYQSTKKQLENSKELSIVIASYDYSSKLMKSFPNVKWDFLIIDEAHNLRNVFNGTKRAKNLYEVSKGIPKILLTATPLQNKLEDLYGLISFIDPMIFGDQKVFNKRFIQDQDYGELKEELSPVLYRTLRKDVGKYMPFSKRECLTVNFQLSMEEAALYALVNDFLKRDILYSIPSNNNALIKLVIRKLLASSSFAVVETFEVLKTRLKKLQAGTKSAKAQDGFDLFWGFVEDELEEADEDEIDDEDTAVKKQIIQEELSVVEDIIKKASAIKTNAKIKALKEAINSAFENQKKLGVENKVVVFTESKRTQKYIANELRESGFSKDDILLFNGDMDDPMSKQIYQAWKNKTFGNPNYGRSVEYKHAIVDYFKTNSKVLIVTDTGSEGLNLQFCNTVINYDLPWNPQKIEQRIGRCHRYGQKYDVLAINLLNTQNVADARVYEILSKKFELFEGVFGASDIALGILESGSSFQNRIFDIYQNCSTPLEFKKAFDKLDRQIDAKRDKKAAQLRNLLLVSTTEEKGISLDKTKQEIDKYLRQVEYWSKVEDPVSCGQLQYWKIDSFSSIFYDMHGTLFLGAFCDSNRVIYPVLLLCDEKGHYIDFDEDDLLPILEKVDDDDIKVFKPSDEENILYQEIYDTLTNEMKKKHDADNEPIKEYNKKKVENWIEIQKEQLNIRIEDMDAEIKELEWKERCSKAFLEKVDIRKDIDAKKDKLMKLQGSYHSETTKIQEEADKKIREFNKQFDINPILLIDVVIKF